jgi:hypothetical protein
MSNYNNVKAYYESERLSYSKIKDYDFSPSYYLKKHIEKTLRKTPMDESMLLGSICHTLLLTPLFFDKEYIVFDKKLTASTALLLDFILNKAEEYKLTYDQIDNEYVLLCAKELNLFSNIKDEQKIIQKLVQNGLFEVLELKLVNKDKHVISTSLLSKANWIIDIMRQNDFINEILEDNNSSPKRNVHNEFPIYWKYILEQSETGVVLKAFDCKSLIDKMVIDHGAKTVMIYDLKFISDETVNFRRATIKYKYYLQAGFYVQAVKFWLSLIYLDKISEYSVMFRFIVTNVNNPQDTIIYSVPKILLNKAFDGYDSKVHNKKLDGLQYLITSIAWAHENNHFIYKKNEYENKAIIELDIE